MGIFNWKKFPYTNFHELNLDYFINKFNEIFAEWETLYNTLNTWKDETTTELEEWKTATEQDLDDREATLRAELDAWKTATQTDISTWETETLASLNAWKTATTIVFEEIRTAAANSATAAANSATAAANSVTAAANSATAAANSAENAEDSAEEAETSVRKIAEPNPLYEDGILYLQGIRHDNGEIFANTSFTHTDYIDISNVTSITYPRYHTKSSSSALGIAFYDENKTYISGEGGVTSYSENTWIAQETDIPENAKYCRISFSASLPVSDFYVYEPNNYINKLENKVNKNSENIDILTNDIEAINPIDVTWTTGSWSNSGASNSTSTHIKTSFFQCKKCRITITGDYCLMIGKWDTETATAAHYLGNVLGSYSYPAYNVKVFEFIGNESEYYRVSLRDLDGTIDPTIDDANVSIVDIIPKIDYKASKDEVNNGLASKINIASNGNGSNGQVLTSNGTSTPTWETPEQISGTAVTQAVEDWLENNPQVFLNVENKSITESKFANNALRYISPFMFGAIGDGEISDDEALQNAIDYAITNNIILDGKGQTFAIEGLITPPWATASFPIKGIYANGSITIKNMNLFVKNNSAQGTSALHIRCVEGQKIIIDNVNINGNRLNNSSSVTGDGNMTGIKVCTRVKGYKIDGGDITIKNCYIKDCYTDAIGTAALNYTNLTIENCVFESNGRNGITDNALNSRLINCSFINNGVRTLPKTQYEVEPESAVHYTHKIIENCKFTKINEDIRDIVFLFKIYDSDTESTSVLDNFVVKNCNFDKIAFQSFTSIKPAIYNHITIDSCNFVTISLNVPSQYLCKNNDMVITNCKLKEINVNVGNVRIIDSDITGLMAFTVTNLIMTGNYLTNMDNWTFAPRATKAIIDNNIFEHYTLNTGNISRFIGENII